jgi:hypothetical protein
MENRIYELIVQIWNEEKIPSSWTEALICPTRKVMSKIVRIPEEYHLLILRIGYCQLCYMED